MSLTGQLVDHPNPDLPVQSQGLLECISCTLEINKQSSFETPVISASAPDYCGMWLELAVFMSVIRSFQYCFRRRSSGELGKDGLLKFTVARSFQASHGGNIYQALRIPDTGGRGYQVLDVLLLTEQGLYVFSVLNTSCILKAGHNGTWLEKDSDGCERECPNAVMELRDRAVVLTEYIARRGIALPNDFLKLRVVFVNEMSRPEQDILLLPEVVSYDRWEDIRSKASSSSIFGMNSHLNSSLNSDVALCNQLHYILNTAPTWDRLKLRGGGLLFGEFIRFKGASQSLEALNVAKRSKISHYEAIHKWSFWALLGIHPVTEVKMICHLRDSRQGISAQPDKFEVCVQGDLEVVFQPLEAAKPRTIELRDICSLSLYT